jgi:hypothetical protein
MFVHLHNRSINLGHIQEIFWLHGTGVQPGLIGCHVYFMNGREIDLTRVEANILFDQLRKVSIETENLPAIKQK